MKIIATPKILEVNDNKLHLDWPAEYAVGAYNDVLETPVTLRYATELAHRKGKQHGLSYSSVSIDFKRLTFTYQKEEGEGWDVDEVDVGKFSFQFEDLKMPLYSKYLKVVGTVNPNSKNLLKDLEMRLNGLQIEGMEVIPGKHVYPYLEILVTDKFTIDVKY